MPGIFYRKRLEPLSPSPVLSRMIFPNLSSVFDAGIAVIIMSTCHTSNSYSWISTCLYNIK